MKNTIRLVVAATALSVWASIAPFAVAAPPKSAPATPAAIARAAFDAAKNQKSEAGAVTKNLATFDDLDFNVFSNGKWDELGRSHSRDVTVHWPDGRVTHGIETHIKDLKALFVFAPDTRILQHPIKVGQGDHTSVVGIFEGTFTNPMPIGDGKTIPPTGKAFKILMCTVAHWKNGVMDEEFLFWDNAEFAKEIGIGK